MFPKLDWSAPRDAAWINGGTLRCERAGDVYLLLKSSEFVSHDLTTLTADTPSPPPRPAAAAPPVAEAPSASALPLPFAHKLVLRRWSTSLGGGGGAPAPREFRCFVRRRRLVAVCQRDVATRHTFLHAERPRIARALSAFFGGDATAGEPVAATPATTEAAAGDAPAAGVAARFASARFCADVLVELRGAPADDRVKLLDFNPWAGATDSLLFAWDTPPLAEEEPTGGAAPGDDALSVDDDASAAADELFNGFAFRLVDMEQHVRDPLARFRGPADALALGVDLEARAALGDFLRKCEDTARKEACESPLP